MANTATLLIVDQEKILVDLLIRALSSDDLSVLGTTSVDEAVRLIDVYGPALLVIDTGIPNGIPLISSVQAGKLKVQVLAVTASAEVRDKVRSMGIDTIDRSSGLEELVAAIRGLLETNVRIMGTDDSIHVLVTDDSDEMRTMLSVFLSRKGFSVSLAKNGLEAIQQVKNDPKLRIALLDVSMPEMGGLDALREIKTINPLLNVIVMTAVNDSQVARLAVETGAFDYILKPFSFDQIESSITACLHHAEYEKKKSWWKW
jgi:DNA-binding NtrC family response regulator